MAREIKKPHNGGQWTDARKKSFIVSALRQATMKWGPMQQCLKNAKPRRGVGVCDNCNTEGPVSLDPEITDGKRIKNLIADHIEPIIDPATGFVDWNSWIERAFVELDGFQALCRKCHTKKTAEEKAIAKERRASR